MLNSRSQTGYTGELSSPAGALSQPKPAEGARSGTSDTTATTTTQTQSGPYGLSSPTTAEERGVEDERKRPKGKGKEGSCPCEFGENHITVAGPLLVGAGAPFAPTDAVALPALLSAFYPAAPYTFPSAPFVLSVGALGVATEPNADALDVHHAFSPLVNTTPSPQKVTLCLKDCSHTYDSPTNLRQSISNSLSTSQMNTSQQQHQPFIHVDNSTTNVNTTNFGGQGVASLAPIMLTAPVMSALYVPSTRALQDPAPLTPSTDSTSPPPESASLLHAAALQEVTHLGKIEEATILLQRINTTSSTTMGPCVGGLTLVSLAFTMAVAALRAAELEEDDMRRFIREDEKKEREKAVRMAQNANTFSSAFSQNGKRQKYNKIDSDDFNNKIKATAGSSDASTNARGRTTAAETATDKIAPTRISDSRRIELFGEQHIRDAFELAARPNTSIRGGGNGERSEKPPLGSESRLFSAGEHSHDHQVINVCTTTSKRDGVKMNALSTEKKVSSLLTKSNIEAIQTVISTASAVPVTPHRQRDAVVDVSTQPDPPTATTASSSSTTCPCPSNAPRSCFSPLDAVSTDTPTELLDHATTCTGSTGADTIAAIGHHSHHTQRRGGGLSSRINDYTLPPPTTSSDNVSEETATVRKKRMLSSMLSSPSSSPLNDDDDEDDDVESKHMCDSGSKKKSCGRCSCENPHDSHEIKKMLINSNNNDKRTGTRTSGEEGEHQNEQQRSEEEEELFTHRIVGYHAEATGGQSQRRIQQPANSPLTAHALSNRSALCVDTHPVTVFVSSPVSTAAAQSHAPATTTTDTAASQTSHTTTTTTTRATTTTSTHIDTTRTTTTTTAETTDDTRKTASSTNKANTKTIGTTSATATTKANVMTTEATTTSATAADSTNPTSSTNTATASGLGTSRSNTNSSSRSQAYSLFPRLLESFLFRGFYCKHLTLKGDCRDDRIHTYVHAAPATTTTNTTTEGTRSSKTLGSGATTPHRSVSGDFCGENSAAYTVVEKSRSIPATHNIHSGAGGSGVTNNTASLTNALLMGTASSATGSVSAGGGGGGGGSFTASSLDGTPYSQALGYSAELSFSSSRGGGNTPVLVLDAADRAYLKHVAESLGYEGVGGVSVHTPPSSLRRGSPAAGMVPLYPTASSTALRSVTPRSHANSENSNAVATTAVSLSKPTSQKKAALAAASRSLSRVSSTVAALETLTPRGADAGDGPPASRTSAVSSNAFGPSPTAIAHNPSIMNPTNMCLSRAVLQLAQNQRAALCTLRALRDPSNAAFQAAANGLPCQSFSFLHSPFDLGPQQLKTMIPAPYLCFYASEVPPMPIGEYIAFLYRHRPIGPEVFMLAMGVLWRVSRRLPVCSRSLHRMLLTAVVLSQKSRGESPYILSYYAGMGGVQADDLGVMERAMLSVLKYDLFGSQGTRLYVDIVYSLRVHCQITATLLREDWVSGAWSEATASLPIPCLDAFEREQRAEMAVLMAADKARMASRKPFSSSVGKSIHSSVGKEKEKKKENELLHSHLLSSGGKNVRDAVVSVDASRQPSVGVAV